MYSVSYTSIGMQDQATCIVQLDQGYNGSSLWRVAYVRIWSLLHPFLPLQTETPKSVSRRGSNQSVSNSALSQTPKVASGVLGVGIIGHAAGIYNELRERFEDEEEIIFEENDDELRAEEVGQHPFWKGPVYMSPPCQ